MRPLEPFYASDYFEPLYEYALELIRKGKAYVCDHTAEEVDAMRGAPDRPGQESAYRDRSVAENLDLFQRMRAGEFPDGARTLRAKIDMSAPNVWLRDPVLYRIRHASHHHTGDQWCIYPMYDFAHGLSDYIEGITHSICTLEFEVHRPLYEWILEALDLPRTHPRQREFARLNVTYTVMSKRKLLRLVQEGHVRGWDDPRMPTISGMRRRGYPAEAIRDFCERIGVAKRENMVQLELLEHCVREDLNRRAPRAMAVLRPLRVVIENYPEGQVEEMEAVNNPEDAAMGTRRVPFSRVIYIEQDDFREVPPPKYHRLSPGVEVRLRYAYLITCTGVVKDPQTGEVVEVRARYDPATRGGDTPDGRKVKATIHWVSAAHAVDAEVRLYETLFAVENPEDVPEGQDFTQSLNPGRWRPCRAASSSRRWPRRSRARATSSSGSATSAPTRRTPAPVPRLQPHRHAEGRLGQDREEAGPGLDRPGLPSSRRPSARRYAAARCDGDCRELGPQSRPRW